MLWSSAKYTAPWLNEVVIYSFPNEMYRRDAVHASDPSTGSGLSTNGECYAIAILNPFTLSLSKPVLSLSKGANALHFKKEHYIRNLVHLRTVLWTLAALVAQFPAVRMLRSQGATTLANSPSVG
jgi:hypothetical protein